MLATCYTIGKGVMADDGRAVELFKRASTAGNADAMCALAYRSQMAFSLRAVS